MTTLTLKTLVLKTATVGSVKLSTPADRIGLGFTVVADYPMDLLSSGQFPLPPNPEPENGPGSRQVPSMLHQHEPMQPMATAAAPASSAGCLNVPGSTSVWSDCSRSRLALAGWRGTSKRTGRAKLPARAGRLIRIGSDCQSPDRNDDRLARARRARVSARAFTTAGK